MACKARVRLKLLSNLEINTRAKGRGIWVWLLGLSVGHRCWKPQRPCPTHSDLRVGDRGVNPDWLSANQRKLRRPATSKDGLGEFILPYKALQS